MAVIKKRTNLAEGRQAPITAEESSRLRSQWGAFFSSPIISALCQANPFLAGIATYFSTSYQEEQWQTMSSFMQSLDERMKEIEDDVLTQKALESTEGKRIIGKIFRAILRDNRADKIAAMSTLTINLYTDTRLTVDEKEVYVDILDGLNPLQLSILQKAVSRMRERGDPRNRAFGWERLCREYEQAGVTKALLLQSIRTLESNGLVNKNDAVAQEADQTHFVTDFGERFYDYITTVVRKTPRT